MFFYLTKLLTLLLLPSSVVTLLLIAGIGLSWSGRSPLWSRRILTAGVGLLVLLGLSPLGNLLVLPLEQRFERPQLPAEVAGIIVLGGFEITGITAARGQLSLNEGGERLTETLLLARRLPRARVVFTGGDASLVLGSRSAADSVGGFLQQAGIEPGRIVLEGKSRTTYENALFLAGMLTPKPGERWVLVTSAFHMPRSVGSFRRQGFDVVPWPVDYRTSGPDDWLGGFSAVGQGLDRVDLSLREWAGLIGYRLSGRTDALWPGPAAEPVVAGK